MVWLAAGCTGDPADGETTGSSSSGTDATLEAWNYTTSFDLAYAAGVLGKAIPTSECVGIRLTLPPDAQRIQAEFNDQDSGPGGVEVRLYDPQGHAVDYALAGVPDQAVAEYPSPGEWTVKGEARLTVGFEDMVQVVVDGAGLDPAAGERIADSVVCIEE